MAFPQVDPLLPPSQARWLATVLANSTQIPSESVLVDHVVTFWYVVVAVGAGPDQEEMFWVRQS
jgi:hypothetical protein